ncbi:MAG: sporulation protein YqfC [Peptococcaceae bacterium]|nr:sporulation protein YqfC [Peptococcaceae bacterium]
MVFKQFQAKLGNALDLPQEVMLNAPKITIVGDVQIWIENHTGLIEYSTEKIRVNTNLGHLNVTGRDFSIVKLLPAEILVEGKLQRLEFGEA